MKIEISHKRIYLSEGSNADRIQMVIWGFLQFQTVFHGIKLCSCQVQTFSLDRGSVSHKLVFPRRICREKTAKGGMTSSGWADPAGLWNQSCQGRGSHSVVGKSEWLWQGWVGHSGLQIQPSAPAVGWKNWRFKKHSRSRILPGFCPLPDDPRCPQLCWAKAACAGMMETTEQRGKECRKGSPAYGIVCSCTQNSDLATWGLLLPVRSRSSW